MKKLLSLLVVCVMVLSSVAVFAAEKVELRMAWWGSQNRHDRTIKVIELFQQKYPNITITYEPSSWADHWTKMSTQAAGGNLPDLMQQDYAYLLEWTGRGLIRPLDDFVADGTLNLKDVPESLLAGGKIDGKLYGVNLGANSLGWVFDVAALEKAGIPLPPQNWTWADFEKLMLQLHEKLGIWGTGGGLSHYEIAWKSLYLGLGEWVYTKDGKGFGYENDQPLVDFMKMILRLQDAKAIPTREEEIGQAAGTGLEDDPIVVGKAATKFMWSNQLVATWKAAGENRKFVMQHLPRVKADGPASNYIKPSMFFSVTSQAKHPKEAAMFIDFFTNSLEANKILMAERGVPVSSVVAKGLEELLSPAEKESFAYMARVAKDNCPLPAPDPKKQNDFVTNVYWPEFADLVLTNQMSPEDGVKALRKLGVAALSAE